MQKTEGCMQNPERIEVRIRVRMEVENESLCELCRFISSQHLISIDPGVWPEKP